MIFHVVTFLKPTVRFTTAYPSGVSQNGLRRGLEYEPSKNEFAKQTNFFGAHPCPELKHEPKNETSGSSQNEPGCRHFIIRIYSRRNFEARKTSFGEACLLDKVCTNFRIIFVFSLNSVSQNMKLLRARIPSLDGARFARLQKDKRL